MPKTANRPSQGHTHDAGTGKAGFLFVSVTGEHSQPDDPKARKVIRTHVMRNYLEHTSDEPNKRPVATIQPIPAPVVGQKLRFRLKKDKLEQSLPLRSRVKPVTRPKGNAERREKEDKTAAPSAGYLRESKTSPITARNAHSSRVASVAPNRGGVKSPLLSWVQTTSELWPDLFEDPFSTLGQEVELALPTSPLHWFGNSRIDPLGVLPLELTPFDEVLVDRFQNYMPESWCPVSGQSAWFPFAINDQLLFHATLYNWAMHFADATHDGSFARHPGIMRHKLNAIHMINEKLSDPVEAVRDENLGAVVAIINVEVAYGSAKESERHMAGLRAMVDMRGGIETLGDGIGGLLQRLVGWTDLNYAELHGAPLIFTKENCDWDRVRAEAGWSGPSSNRFHDSSKRGRIKLDLIPGSGAVEWNEAGDSFTISNVLQRKYQLGIMPLQDEDTGEAAFYVQSVQMRGQDIQGQEFSVVGGAAPIDIVLADDFGTLTGTVTDPDGKPVSSGVRVEGRGYSISFGGRDDGKIGPMKLPLGEYVVDATDTITIGRDAPEGASKVVVPPSGSVSVSLKTVDSQR